MKNYIKRISDGLIENALSRTGGVLVAGAKAVGKTYSSLNFSKSSVNLETKENLQDIIAVDKKLLLNGQTPHLIDEWQVVPELWNIIRHEIDRRNKKGQFILTGSSIPSDMAKFHSAAGRISKIIMRPFSFLELGLSKNQISLAGVLEKEEINFENIEYTEMDVDNVLEKIIIGGWPNNIGITMENAIKNNRDYVDAISDIDIFKFGNKKRDPIRVSRLLESYSKNIATSAKITNITKDVTENYSDMSLTEETVSNYISDLERLMVIENLPAWNTHIRSSAKLRTSPKRHFVDPSLAVAKLGLSKDNLIEDLNYTGFLFESQVLMNIRIYAQNIDAKVYYYLDSFDDEVDIIVEKQNGDFAAFEVKLGAGAVPSASEGLLKFKKKLFPEKLKHLQSLNIITGTGIPFKTKDDINVIPLGVLGI
jgi:predicted AAA+ superfamily ATPase